MKILIVACLIFCGVVKAATTVVNPYLFSTAFDPSAQDYFTRVLATGATLNTNETAQINTFVVAAKAHGYWSNLIDVNPYCSDSITGAIVKLKYPNYAPSTNVIHGFTSGSYSRSFGFQGDGSSYLETGVNATNIGAYGGLSFYLVEDTTTSDNALLIGSTYGTPQAVIYLDSGNGSAGWGNNFASFGLSRKGPGLVHVFSQSGGTTYTFVNGVQFSSTSASGSTPRNVMMTVFDGGAQGVATTRRGAFYSVDDGQMTLSTASLFGNDTRILVEGLGRKFPAPYPMNFVPHIGQSLALGTEGSPTLSTTQSYSNRMGTLSVTRPDVFGNMAALLDFDVETVAPGMSSTISALSRSLFSNDATNDTVHLSFAHGGQPYSNLKKGTTFYNDSITGFNTALSISDAYNTSFRIPGLVVIHGEADFNSPIYQSDIEQWQSDYQTDIQSITGQTNTVPLFHSQPSSWTYDDGVPTYGRETNQCVYGMLEAYKANPNKSVLVCAKYFISGSNRLHLDGYGYRQLGEYYAKAWWTNVVLGQTWVPLYPTNVARSGATITLTFPSSSSLQLDTTLVATNANWGFEFFDDAGPSVSISSVAFTGASPTNQVQIVLSGTPSGGNKRIRYAYTGTNIVANVVSSHTGQSPTYGPRGNLKRPETYFTSLYSNNLDDWCLHFDEVCP